jgi:hypothetical protein
LPRGGKRSGTPGTAYSNRSDLQGAQLPPTAGPSQQYGQRAAQMAAQQAVPMGSGPQMPAAPPASTSPVAGGAAPEQPYTMPQLTPLDAPTQRPGEPVTTGLPVGPGAGPEALGIPQDDIHANLRAIYQAFPSEDLRAVLEALDNQQ